MLFDDQNGNESSCVQPESGQDFDNFKESSSDMSFSDLKASDTTLDNTDFTNEDSGSYSLTPPTHSNSASLTICKCRQ